ncbi:MAG: Ig-like domain-containing protein [Oscillospiraceae bacterium]|nr:Ig-like domain-containing protein [Oscillospiraceae bacterium]
MKKKFLSAVLAAAVMFGLFSAFPITAGAATTGLYDMDYTKISSGSTVKGSTLTDVDGNKYSTAFYLSSTYSTVTYNVKNYSWFSGIIATPNAGAKSNGYWRVKIDGTTVFESHTFYQEGTVRAQAFNIDISAADTLELWTNQTTAGVIYDGKFSTSKVTATTQNAIAQAKKSTVNIFDMEYTKISGGGTKKAPVLKDSQGNSYKSGFFLTSSYQSVTFDVKRFKKFTATVATPNAGASGSGYWRIKANGTTVFESNTFKADGSVKLQKIDLDLSAVDTLEIWTNQTAAAALYDGTFSGGTTSGSGDAAEEVIPQITLKVGDKLKLGAFLTPSSSKDSVKWKSSKKSVASVSSSGQVTAKAKGSATITVTAASGAAGKLRIKVT